jgi:hypothetical protein
MKKKQREELELGLLPPKPPILSAEGQAMVEEIVTLSGEVMSEGPNAVPLFSEPPTFQGAKRLRIAIRSMYIASITLCALVTVMLLLNQFSPNGVGGLRFFIEHTNAMAPSVSRGALLITNYRSPAKIVPGDVITYYAVPGDRDTRLTRIVESCAKQNGKYCYTPRRASTKVLDSIQINHTYVLGVKMLAIPYFGYVISFVRQYAWGLTTLAACLCVAAVLLRQWLKDKHNLVFVDTRPI